MPRKKDKIVPPVPPGTPPEALLSQAGTWVVPYIPGTIPCGEPIRNPTSKNYGKLCGQPAMANGKCRFHRGYNDGPRWLQNVFYTREGIGLPGRRTPYLPENWKEQFEGYLKNKQMMDMDEDLALIETLIMSKLEVVGRSASAEKWVQAAQLHNRVLNGGVAGAQALAELGELLRAGQSAAASESELMGLIEQRRRIIETHNKKVSQEAGILRKDDAFSFVMALVAAVNGNVTDPHLRVAIARDLADILRPAGIRITAGDVATSALEARSEEQTPDGSVLV